MQGLILAVCRILLGAAFCIFGLTKIFTTQAFLGKSFHAYFVDYIQGALAAHPYFFWRPFLENVVASYPGFFSWGVALGETLIGLALLAGNWTRLACFFGMGLMACIHFNTNPFATASPFWSQVYAFLNDLSLILLFLILGVFGAGNTLGLDGLRRRAREKEHKGSKKKKQVEEDEEE